MAIEDYPYCIYCDSKINWVILDEEATVATFICKCGEAIEVELGLEYDEGLLRDSGSSEGR